MLRSRPSVPSAGDEAPALTAAQLQKPGLVRRMLTVRPWIVPSLLVVAMLLVALINAALIESMVQSSVVFSWLPEDTSRLRTVPGVALAGSVVGAALLPLRARRPLAVVVVLTVLAVVSLALVGAIGVLGLCLALGLSTVAATHEPRTTWAVLVASLVVVTVALALWQDFGFVDAFGFPDPPPGYWESYDTQTGIPVVGEVPYYPERWVGAAVLQLLLMLVAVATGLGTRARHLHAQGIVERYTAMARDRDTSAELARAAERARIAREVHDIVAHNVSVMVALSDGAEAAFDRAPEQSREALREVSRTGRAALADMQRVLGATSTDLAPTDTDLAPILERFRAAGLPVVATGLDVALPRDTSVRLALVRITTEALTNVLRHAPGTSSAEVALRRTPTTVEVEILDSGGIRPSTGGGSGRGIVGMHERAALLGGHVAAGPRPGGGWRVHLTLPYDDQHRDDEER